jgi:hypothetical protein
MSAGLGATVASFIQSMGGSHSWFGGRPLTRRGLTLEAFLKRRGVPERDARWAGREFEKRFDNPPAGREHETWVAVVDDMVQKMPRPPLTTGEWNQWVDNLRGYAPFYKAGHGQPPVDWQMGRPKYVPAHLLPPAGLPTRRACFRTIRGPLGIRLPIATPCPPGTPPIAPGEEPRPLVVTGGGAAPAQQPAPQSASLGLLAIGLLLFLPAVKR